MEVATRNYACIFWYKSCNIVKPPKTNITNITIPPTITTLGKYCFEGCTALKNVIFEDLENWQFESYKPINESFIRIGGERYGNYSVTKVEQLTFTYNSRIFDYFLKDNIKTSSQFDLNYQLNKYNRFASREERIDLLKHMLDLGKM